MTPLGYLYGAIANARNALYDKGVFKSHALGAKTISIGNITVGGTGKTPLVAFVAETLFEAGEKVCVLTRGYGRENPGQRVLVTDGEKIPADVRRTGDEPFELARKLSGKAVIVADANRVSAGRWAREKFGITAFVLDDAFQHRKAKRDLDIVCVDAINPFGNGKVLPAGILREPLENLKRAGAVVITRANLAENVENLKSEISSYTDCPIFVSRNEFSNFTEINNSETRNSKIKIQKSLAFCALGNPNNFFEQLKRDNFNLIATESFPDHHFYKQKDIEKLKIKAKSQNIEVLLTTAKDAVKLAHLETGMPCYVIENKLVFEYEKKFSEMIRKDFDT